MTSVPCGVWGSSIIAPRLVRKATKIQTQSTQTLNLNLLYCSSAAAGLTAHDNATKLSYNTSC